MCHFVLSSFSQRTTTLPAGATQGEKHFVAQPDAVVDRRTSVELSCKKPKTEKAVIKMQHISDCQVCFFFKKNLLLCFFLRFSLQ